MKITKSQLKQIIKEELESVLNEKSFLASMYRDFGKKLASGGFAGKKSEPEGEYTQFGDPESVPDIEPSKLKQIRPSAYEFSDEPVGELSDEEFAKIASPEEKKQLSPRQMARTRLKNAKEKMRKARIAVKAELRKPENKGKNIYDLPKTPGSPRAMFAKAYTALKRAKKRM